MAVELKPNSQYVSDAAFFANQGLGSSLPVSNPTEPATSQEPVQDAPANQGQPTAAQLPLNPIAAPFPASELPPPPAAEPTPAPVVEEPTIDPNDLFSTELPNTVPEPAQDPLSVDTGTVIPDVSTTVFDEFKPAADAPDWQREQFANIVNDPNFSEQDKRDILAQNPHSWVKQRKWQRDSRTLGRFRDPNVPITDILGALREQNTTRAEQLEIESAASLLSNAEKIVRFAESQPEVYSQLMLALITEAPEQMTQVLGKQGYLVTKAEPANADDILAKLMENPYYASIRDTEFGDEVVNTIRDLATKAGSTEPTEPTEPNQPAPTGFQNPEFVSRVTETVETTKTQVWDKALSDGLAREGIKPATKEEIAANPLAYFKTIMHNIAVHGLEGVVPSSDKQIDKFVGDNPDYLETLQALDRYLSSGELDKFKDEAKTLAPVYHQFGAARAGIPFIKGLYNQVQKLLGEKPAVTQPPPPEPTVPQTPTGNPPITPRDNGWASDRLFFEKQNRQ